PPVGAVCLKPAPDPAVAAGRGRGRVEAGSHVVPPRSVYAEAMSSRVCSVMASVGQVSAHAPQETHVESSKPLSRPAVMPEWKPRPVAVRANAPWTSSQARTQRPHEMHS